MAHIANILYPVFLYFLISEGASLVMQLLAVSAKMDAVMRQGICSARGFAALLWYQNGKQKKTIRSRNLWVKDRNIIGIGCIVSVLLPSKQNPRAIRPQPALARQPLQHPEKTA